MKNPSVLVCGTGAMGSLFSGLLSLSGNEVKVLGTWQEGLNAIHSRGVRISRLGKVLLQSKPLPISSNLSEGESYDLVLILVKTYHTVGLIKRLQGLDPTTPILTLQNGVGNRELIQGEFKNPVNAGVTNIGAMLTSPGNIEWIGDGGTILPEGDQFKWIFERGSTKFIKTCFTKDLDQAIWRKLIINAAINPLTAIYTIKNGDLLKRGEARERMLDIITECQAISERKGFGETVDSMISRVNAILKVTSNNTSSMLSDVIRGGPTEVESINGAIIIEGRRMEIPTPANLKAYEEVKRLENQPA